MLFFWLWVLLLAALLFYPVSKLVWVLSVRRLERRLSRELDAGERHAQLKRARTLAAMIAFMFSWLYNLQTIGPPGGG